MHGIWDGSSDYGAHARSELGNSIWSRQLFTSIAALNLIFFACFPSHARNVYPLICTMLQCVSLWVYLPWFFSIFAMVSMTVAAADQSPAEPDQEKLLRIRICRFLSPDSSPKSYFNWVDVHFYWLTLIREKRKTVFAKNRINEVYKGSKMANKNSRLINSKLNFFHRHLA